MTTVYVDRMASALELRDGVITVRMANGTAGARLPARLATRIVLRGDTQVSARTLAALADVGVAVACIAGRGGDRVAMLLGAPHNDAAIRVAQIQTFARAGFAMQLAAHWVRQKIVQQRAMLAAIQAQRPDLRKPTFDAMAVLANCLDQLGRGRDVAQVRGLEGAAAAAYFPAYFAAFAPSLGATHRSRRPPKDPVNACLSLGYTLLYARAVQAAHASGLDPAVGTLHGLAYGRAALACDVMEPLRPVVDQLVYELFRSETLRAAHFSSDGGQGVLMGKAGRGAFYQAFEEIAPGLDRALRQRCRALVRILKRSATGRATVPEHWATDWETDTAGPLGGDRQ